LRFLSDSILSRALFRLPCNSRFRATAVAAARRERRKRGPDVWCFRWREGGPDGRGIHRRIALGTADDLKSIASARKAVVGLRREINLNDVRTRREAITLADLSRHFQQQELVRGNTRIAYSTRKAYEGYLRKWIEPRWGEYRLFEIGLWKSNRHPLVFCVFQKALCGDEKDSEF
jgi:hypothetical protein